MGVDEFDGRNLLRTQGGAEFGDGEKGRKRHRVQKRESMRLLDAGQGRSDCGNGEQ